MGLGQTGLEIMGFKAGLDGVQIRHVLLQGEDVYCDTINIYQHISQLEISYNIVHDPLEDRAGGLHYKWEEFPLEESLRGIKDHVLFITKVKEELIIVLFGLSMVNILAPVMALSFSSIQSIGYTLFTIFLFTIRKIIQTQIFPSGLGTKIIGDA